MPPPAVPYYPYEDPRPCPVRYMTAIARTYGLLTAAAIWTCMVKIMSDRDKYDTYTHWYLLAVAVVVTFFEITWMIDKCACCTEIGCCYKVWRAIMWIDDWKKSLVYICLALPCFSAGLAVLLGVISGLLLLLCAAVYVLKSCRYLKCWYRWNAPRQVEGDGIIHQEVLHDTRAQSSAPRGGGASGGQDDTKPRVHAPPAPVNTSEPPADVKTPVQDTQ